MGRYFASASALLFLVLAGCNEGVGGPIEISTRTPQQRLARSLAIIRTAEPASPKVLKVLFYGQSISQRAWTDQSVAHLRKTYPAVRFVVRNMAIGGFAAPLLERTTARDLAEFYPDLVVFHVYGDHRAYERIIRTMRALTAAEIIIQTDHITEPMEPLCDTGLHLSLAERPGCRGRLWYRQHNWSDFMSGRFEPDLARRYGLAIEPRRWAWAAYLRRNHLPIAALLADSPHPNAAGWRLMARLFDTWFDGLVAGWRGGTQTLVRDVSLPPSEIISVPFEGNRIELFSSRPLNGMVTAEIDGKPPQALDGCWQTSRTSTLPGVPEWPSIRQVTVDPAFHRPERWTATVYELDPAQRRFKFRLVGDATGPDGAGSGDRDFVSPSGRIRIAAKDWVLPDQVALKGKRVPNGFRVVWDTHFACHDEPAVSLAPSRIEVRHIIATGLSNGRHRLTLHIDPKVRPAITALRVYRPPLAGPAPLS